MRFVNSDQPQGIRTPTGLGIGGNVSKQLEAVMNQVQAHMRVPVAAYGYQWLIKEEVARVLDACGRADWDGEGAAAVTSVTAEFACDFADILPPGLPSPNVEAGAVGEIVLEWRPARRRVLIVSLYEDRSVGYAAFMDEVRSHGRVPFEGRLPEEVLTQLKALHNL